MKTKIFVSGFHILLIPILIISNISCSSLDEGILETPSDMMSSKSQLNISPNQRVVQGQTLNEFLVTLKQKKGKELTEKEKLDHTKIFNTFFDLNEKVSKTVKKECEQVLPCIFHVDFGTVKKEHFGFQNVEELLAFLEKNFPLKVIQAPQPLSKISEYPTDPGEIRSGTLSDAQIIQMATGGVAVFGVMSSTYYYSNNSQISFVENFSSWSCMGFTASIEEKEHSSNGARVVFGKGVLKAGFGFAFGPWDFSLQQCSVTLQKSHVLNDTNL